MGLFERIQEKRKKSSDDLEPTPLSVVLDENEAQEETREPVIKRKVYLGKERAKQLMKELTQKKELSEENGSSGIGKTKPTRVETKKGAGLHGGKTKLHHTASSQDEKAHGALEHHGAQKLGKTNVIEQTGKSQQSEQAGAEGRQAQPTEAVQKAPTDVTGANGHSTDQGAQRNGQDQKAQTPEQVKKAQKSDLDPKAQTRDQVMRAQTDAQVMRAQTDAQDLKAKTSDQDPNGLPPEALETPKPRQTSGHLLSKKLNERLNEEKSSVPSQPLQRGADTSHKSSSPQQAKLDPKHHRLKEELQKRILKEYRNVEVEQIVAKLEGLALEIIKEDDGLKGTLDRKRIIEEITNELNGFGPINPLLLDDDVSEVMVNGPHQVYAEKKGKLILTDVTFRDDEHVMNIIEKIVSPLGRRIDESSPMVDARLPDGSRVNAIIPPLALNGPTLTIRKFSKDPFTVADLISFGTLNAEMATFLDACIKARLNVFVSGGTGSGKTTTLNVLSSYIPNDERIITIEDAAELQLGQDHVVSLETRPPNIEGKGGIAIRDLVRNSLRMRPERIIIGEVRGAEALDMLQAMNTGHDGSLATGHSNSPRDMLSRLETMVLMAGMDLPIKAIREQIAGAIDVIIQQSRLKDGTRKITSITEVQGLEGDIIVLQDIFTFKQTGIDAEGKVVGKLVPTGVIPTFYERLESAGISIPTSVFFEVE